MANGGSRPIAPVRKLVGAALGTVATFVVLFGLGMPLTRRLILQKARRHP